MPEQPEIKPSAANGPTGQDSEADAVRLEQRIRKLTAENERLRQELARTIAKLEEEQLYSHSLILEGMPVTEEEIQQALSNPHNSISGIIRQFEATSGQSP
jgi:hypothetical protein